MVSQGCALEDLEYSGTAFMNGPIVYRQGMFFTISAVFFVSADLPL